MIIPIKLILSKATLPLLFMLAGSVGTFFALELIQAPIPPCPQCPAVKLPKSVNSGIDIDKIKGKVNTLQVHQNYYVEYNGDSLLIKKLEQTIDSLLQVRGVVRCKK